MNLNICNELLNIKIAKLIGFFRWQSIIEQLVY